MHRTPQTYLDFPGRDRLIADIDTVVVSGDELALTSALRARLCALIDEGALRLPDAMFMPIQDHYARRELYRSPEHGYSVIAMTWAPGQGTPLHDHDGLWCVEGICSGHLEIIQYELLESDGARARFRAHGGMIAGVGSAGSLIPPYEYHVIRNPSDSELAVSVHVYQAPLTDCAVFVPQADGSYLREHRHLPADE